MSAVDPAAPLTDFERGREIGRRIREEHPLPPELAARLGELIRGARTQSTERTAP